MSTVQTTDTIQSLEARRRLGELMELVYYQGRRFRISRKDKPMAWLVGEDFMRSMGRVIDYIIEHEPALADTLAIELDPGLQKTILESRDAANQGQLVPLESILDDSDGHGL